MASPTYDRTIDKSSGNVYINPVPPGNPPTQGIPPLGLTEEGNWVPFLLNADGTIPAGIMGTPHFDDAIDDTTPGDEQTLIDETVPDGVTRNLNSVIVKTRVTGSFQVLSNGELIGSGRTGPGGSPTMTFNPARPLSAGTEYKVVFTSRIDSPVQSVEAYAQSSDSISI